MTQKPQPSPSGKIFVFSLLLLVIAVAVVGAAAWFFITKVQPATDPLNRLRSALSEITQQKITQSGHTLEISTQEVQELAIIEREQASIIKYETTFLGAKKTLILRGDFRVKTGFNLTKATTFSIIEGEVSGDLPEAEILSVEMLGFEIYHSQDRAFNKLTSQDQEIATNQLLKQARKDAEESSLRSQAEDAFKQRLDDLMQAKGFAL